MNLVKWRYVLLIIIIAFFTALFVFVQSFHNSVTSSSKVKSFYKGTQGVALTFNIGWGEENAEKILTALKKADCKSATFFLSGSWAEHHPDIVKKISEQHYEIGILGYNYQNYAQMDEKEITRDVSRAMNVFKKAGLSNISLMRAPTGEFDKKAIKVASKMGLTFVHWSVNTNDWKNPGVNKIVAKVKKAENGDIVLLHASDSALQTAKAIPKIFTTITDNKLHLLTVSEMIANGKSTSKEVQ